MSFSDLCVRCYLIVALLCISVLSTVARTSGKNEGIEEKVERLLQKRDLGDLANELARQTKSQTTESLLIKLSVFARAGHPARVLETIRQIPGADDYKTSPFSSQIFRVAQKALGHDNFPAQKAFYEIIAVSGDENTSTFVALWERQGDLDGLEKWLGVRAAKSETWWWECLGAKQRRGTAQEIYDEMKDNIRQNPLDFNLVRKYLRAVAYDMPTAISTDRRSYVQDVAWLADTVNTDRSYEAYELAVLIKDQAPVVAAKLFEKSLSLPFTQKDRELFGQWAFRLVSIQPVVVNPEKQLRYWTKVELVELYKQSGQPQLAQPLAQQLTNMDTSDIQAGNTYTLAGTVQAASGHRVVESKILQDEVANVDSAQYWLNRASYYKGRGERDEAWQTLIRASEKFPYKPNDYETSFPRLRIFLDLRFLGSSYDARENETRELLKNEIRRAVSHDDGQYIYELTRWMNNDFDDLYEQSFVNTDLLVMVLKSYKLWRDDQEYLINEIMGTEKWDSKKRGVVWDQLTVLARKDIKNRAFSLAEAMDESNRNKIPLLTECLKIAPLEYKDNLNFDRKDVEEELFHTYIETGDWRKAQRMYLNGFRYMEIELGQIALAAAKAGTLKDSLRVWKINANRDRRNMRYLEELSQTSAKPLLREFYLQMKQRDPLTDIPERALSLLK